MKRKAITLLGSLLLAGAMVAQPARHSAAQTSINTPPTLPADYRSKVAAMLLKEFLREGKGRPEISGLAETRGIFGASTGFCVRYPADVRYNFVRRDMRVVAFTAHHDVLSGGKVEYKASYGPNIDCKGAKAWTTFQELERAAGARKKPKQ